MTCKDCLHYDVCNSYNPRFMKDRLKLGDGYICEKYLNVSDILKPNNRERSDT
jgi:hypothetical protein